MKLIKCCISFHCSGIVSQMTPALGLYYRMTANKQTINHFYKRNILMNNVILFLCFSALCVHLNLEPQECEAGRTENCTAGFYNRRMPVLGCIPDHSNFTERDLHLTHIVRNIDDNNNNGINREDILNMALTNIRKTVFLGREFLLRDGWVGVEYEQRGSGNRTYGTQDIEENCWTEREKLARNFFENENMTRQVFSAKLSTLGHANKSEYCVYRPKFLVIPRCKEGSFPVRR